MTKTLAYMENGEKKYKTWTFSGAPNSTAFRDWECDTIKAVKDITMTDGVDFLVTFWNGFKNKTKGRR